MSVLLCNPWHEFRQVRIRLELLNRQTDVRRDAQVSERLLQERSNS